MSQALARLHELFPAQRIDPIIEERPRWCHSELVGRLVELSGQGATATLTLAFGLLLDAQRLGETAAWVAAGPRLFYPPDVAEGGVDLAALAVIRTHGAAAAARAADRLLRSGAFGLLVLDLGRAAGDGVLVDQHAAARWSVLLLHEADPVRRRPRHELRQESSEIAE